MFYEKQNEEGILPQIDIHFNFSLFLFLVILPSAVFAVLSVIFALMKLKRPVMKLLKEVPDIKTKKFSEKDNKSQKELPFLTELKKATLKSKKTLVFLITFAAFCFSSMMQMSFSMKDLSSEMMGAMIFLIGVVLSFTTLFLGISSAGTGKMPGYEFDVKAFIICLIAFALLFEIMMSYCGGRIRKASVKSVMEE